MKKPFHETTGIAGHFSPQVLKGSDLPAKQKKILLDTFSKLNKRILWKWETEDMEDKPDNVMLKKWLPQQDILGMFHLSKTAVMPITHKVFRH